MDWRRTWPVGLLLALAILAMGLFADVYARHGLFASWRVLHEDQLLELSRTTEHRTAFENVNRPLSRYFQDWNFERLGVPDHLPTLDVRFEALLEIPPGPPRFIRAACPNWHRVLIDNGLADDRAIDPGVHRLTVFWHGEVQGRAAANWYTTMPTSLELEWGVPGLNASEPLFGTIPRTALTPPHTSWPPLRVTLWIAAPLLAVVFALLGMWAWTAHRRRRLTILGMIAVGLLGTGLRLFDYGVMPEFRENPDELFATWSGWQLLDDGSTRGWSLWAAEYGERVEHEEFQYFRKRPFRIIRPYLEHPPLAHVLAGGAARIGGASEWAFAKLKHTRLVPIALGILSLILVMLIARRLDGPGMSPLVAGLLYAAMPMIVLQSRVIKEEALLTPLMLGSFLFFLRWRDDGERITNLVVAALLAGLCPLAKVPGAVFIPVLVMLLTAQRRYRLAFQVGLFSVATACLLFVYAYGVDWDLFWFTLGKQAGGRPSHWNIFPRFFDDPLVNHNLVGRGLLIFLWIGWAASTFRRKNEDRSLMVLPTLVYLAAIAVPSGSWTFGWYLMPIYPFLCMGAGKFLADTWKKPGFAGGALFYFLAIMYGMNFLFEEAWMKAGTNWPEIRRWVTVFIVVFVSPFALAHAFPIARIRALARASLLAGLLLFVGLSSFFVVRYDVLYDEYRDFDRNVYFDR